MRKKPKGPRYRNLYARGDSIYYTRVWKGRRFQFSTATSSWDEAAAVRDLWEERKGVGRLGELPAGVPTFGELAKRYLAEGMGHLAPSTQEDRSLLLRAASPESDGRPARPASPLIEHFGRTKVDDIRRGALMRWWSLEVEVAERKLATGRAHLAALAAVLGYAVDLEIIEANPCDAFRATLRRRHRTQRGRAASDPTRNIRPVEEPGDLKRLLAAAVKEGPVPHVYTLLLLDAGLRVGEALGLRWGSIEWGAEGSRRALLIRETRARRGFEGSTKSGRLRRVALSRRLREALADLYRARFEPGPDGYVLEGIDANNFRKREWRRMLKRAKLGPIRPKDLRDSYASHLLTAGVQLGYVSLQLGHSDVSTTARHYARWVGGDEYLEPLRLEPGDVPADLLSRLRTKSHQNHTNNDASEQDARASGGNSAGIWRARHDSNVRPTDSKSGALSG
jgi:integrase